MATGRKAFKRECRPETLTAIIKEEPKPVRELAEELEGRTLKGEMTLLISGLTRQEKKQRRRHEKRDACCAGKSLQSDPGGTDLTSPD